MASQSERARPMRFGRPLRRFDEPPTFSSARRSPNACVKSVLLQEPRPRGFARLARPYKSTPTAIDANDYNGGGAANLLPAGTNQPVAHRGETRADLPLIRERAARRLKGGARPTEVDEPCAKPGRTGKSSRAASP
jgi:hypothetical protein